MATVWVPALLRELTGGTEIVEGAGRTVGEVIESLEAKFPGVRARLCPSGLLEPWLLVSVDGAVAGLGLAEPVGERSEILFVPAMGGGG
jgi:molybdopterin converting factor small subunit